MPLKINGTDVKKISGPVYISILSPTDQYLERFPYAPILILFGDRHGDKEGFCPTVEGETGHYKVFDLNFLQLLSDAVKIDERNETIDFYVEGGELHIFNNDEIDKDDGKPMVELWNLFIKCYFNSRWKIRTILPENKPTCDLIPNIRWQSGDIRYFQTEKINSNINDFIKLLSKKLISSPTKDELKAFLYKELDDKEKNKQRLQSVVFSVEDIKNKYVNTDGLISKQLNRIHDGTEDDVNKYKDEFKERFLNYIQNQFNYYTHKESPKINYIRKCFTNYFASNHFSEEMQTINKLIELDLKDISDFSISLIPRRALMLDLYTMARIYKTMIKSMKIRPELRKGVDNTNVVHPLIVVCYFGTDHTVTIEKYLTSTENKKNDDNAKDYNIEVIKMAMGDRCISFKKEYDLNAMIRRLVGRREDYEKQWK